VAQQHVARLDTERSEVGSQGTDGVRCGLIHPATIRAAEKAVATFGTSGSLLGRHNRGATGAG
jgi:hypothetical protein